MRQSHLAATALAILTPVLVRAQAPGTTLPRLTNAREVGAAVTREYPPTLLQRQMGGTVNVRLHLTEQGAVDSTQVATPTGDAALDSAALRVATVMRFTPARVGGQPRALWIVVPVQFQATARHEPELAKEGPPTRIELLNLPTVVEALRRHYPDVARKAGLRARVTLRLAVSSSGEVRRETVDSTSCFSYFDKAAEDLAGLLRFAPDPRGDTAVQRLTSVTLLFNDSGAIRLPGDSSAPRPAKRDTVKHVTKSPKLINREEISRLMSRRAMGNGGAVYWMLIDEQGKVIGRQVRRTSGTCALDLAGLGVVQAMRFSPGMVDGKPVKVWIQLPVFWKIR